MDTFKKIKKLREEKKITQSEIAENLGISQAAYAKIERPSNPDGKKISIEYGKSIAKTLGVSFNELFEIEVPGTPNLKEMEEHNIRLQKRIEELEEQLDDKRRIIKFLSDNDFTLDIAARIDFLENGRQFTDFNDPDWLEKSLQNRLYDPGDKQSQIRYIESWFDKQLGSKEKGRSK